jgi:hypothetical protein
MDRNKPPTFTFRMTFRGLCLFVPNDDRTAYTVLLPNASPDADIRPQLQECSTHYPWLTFKLKNLCSNLEPDLGDADGYFQLKRHDVQLEVAAKRMRARLRAVPNIDNLYPYCGGVNSIYLQNPGPLTIARILLRRGTLKVEKTFEYNGQGVSAHFVPVPKGVSHKPGPLASKVSLEIKGLSDHIDLTFTVFQKSKKTTLTLRPVKTRKGTLQDVEVVVQNVCGEQVVERGSSRVEPPGQDQDFAWHYMFTHKHPGYPSTSAIHPVPLPAPFAYAMSADSGEGGGLPVRCTLAQANPPPKVSARSEQRRVGRSPRASSGKKGE